MVGSLGAGDVLGRFFIFIWSFGSRVNSYSNGSVIGCSEVLGRFFMIIWSFGSKVTSYANG